MEDLKRLLKESFEDLTETSGGRGYRYFHSINTYNNCKDFLSEKKPNVNRKALLTAALFHDIGILVQKGKGGVLEVSGDEEFRAYERVFKHEEDEHIERGIEWVEENLKSYLSPPNLEKVKEIIRNHHNNSSDIKEVKILQDAEDVGRMGPLGVWRMFTYSAFHNNSISDQIRFWKEEGLPKRRKEIEKMNFNFFKKKAKEKLQRVRRFFKELEEQIYSGYV